MNHSDTSWKACVVRYDSNSQTTKRHRKQTLVVDDEPNIRDLLASSALRRFEVSTAEDGASAIHLATTEHEDLIVLDVMLPDMDGSRSRAASAMRACKSVLPNCARRCRQDSGLAVAATITLRSLD